MLTLMDEPKKHRVACGVLVDNGRVLLVHRSSSKRWDPNVWDFPGGHLEPGERSVDALVRELREELSVEIDSPPGPPLRTIELSDACIDIWAVVQWNGAIANAAPDEHDTYGWFTPDEAKSLDLANAIYPALIELAVT
jgi:8-oxo-dGTP diphosphatase